mgnify:FL=1
MAHMKAHVAADATPVTGTAVPTLTTEQRVASLVKEARTLPMPSNGEMAVFAVETFHKALPAEGATLDADVATGLYSAITRLATCHRIAGRYEDEKRCATVAGLALTVARITAK